MPNNTTTQVSAPFVSIDSSDLSEVQGGCGKRRCRRRCSKSQQTNIVNNYNSAPAPAAPAPAETSTSVSVGYA